MNETTHPRRGGLNETDRLRKSGIDAKKASLSRVALDSFEVVATGATAHPRRHLPIDPVLKAKIKREGIPGKFRARENGDRMEVIDGARRTKAGLAAQKELQRDAPRQPPLQWRADDPDDAGRLYVDTEVFIGDDTALLLERLDANVNRGLPDVPSVLAAIVGGLVAIRGDEPDKELMARIVAAMPAGIGFREVEALARWGNLVPELRPRFDVGEIPIALLAPVLAAPRGEQVATADRLLASGVKTGKAATRRTNAEREARDPWARRMSPKRLDAFAYRLDAVTMQDETEEARKEGIAIGLRIAGGGNHVHRIIKADPLAEILNREREATKPIHEREARVTKAKKARAK